MTLIPTRYKYEHVSRVFLHLSVVLFSSGTHVIPTRPGTVVPHFIFVFHTLRGGSDIRQRTPVIGIPVKMTCLCEGNPVVFVVMCVVPP